jgi:hypothetical protein
VPDDLIGETLLELERRFHAISSETQVIHGKWENEGRTYRDELVRVFVDVPDSPKNRRFFRGIRNNSRSDSASLIFGSQRIWWKKSESAG